MTSAEGFAVRRSAAAHVLVDAAPSLEVGVIEPDDATEHHLRRVVRLRDGELVTATDGAGSWCQARVRRHGDRLDLVVDGEVVVESRRMPELAIAAAIPKGDRLDWMVQKLTECGADRLTLLDCARSVVRWDDGRRAKQLVRLRRIADDALRQSRRVWSLQIDGPVAASDVLPLAVAAEPGGEPPSPDDRYLAVGPEGGWNDAERGMISRSVDLGPTVLRTETAAIVAATLCVVRDH